MIKIYITAIESRPDGTAVTLFEDYQLNYEDRFELSLEPTMEKLVFAKIEEFEAINKQVTSPF